MTIPLFKIKKVNVITIWFFLVVVSLENFSWLIPADQYIIMNTIKYSDIGVVLALIWIFYVFVFIKYKNRINYSFIPLFFCAIVLVSGVAAYYHLGQDFSLSVRQNRYIIVCMILYYAIVKCLVTNCMEKEDVLKIIAFQAVVEIVLFICQRVLADSVVFLNVSIDMRYGTARVRASYLLALVYAFLCIDRLLNGKNRAFNTIMSISGMSVLVIVCKHRAPTIILLLTLFIIYVIWKKGLPTKVILGVILAVIAVSVVTNSTIFMDSIIGIINGDKNLEIRFLGNSYYLQQLKKSPLVGFGTPNINYLPAMRASGYYNSIVLADNGIFGFVYCFGVIGLIWIVELYIQNYKKAIFLYRKNKTYIYLMYLIFETGNLYMGMHWYYYYTLPFVLILTLMDYDYKCEKNNLIIFNEDRTIQWKFRAF